MTQYRPSEEHDAANRVAAPDEYSRMVLGTLDERRIRSRDRFWESAEVVGVCAGCGYEPSPEFLSGVGETAMDLFHAALEPGTCGVIRRASEIYGEDLMAQVRRLLEGGSR